MSDDDASAAVSSSPDSQLATVSMPEPAGLSGTSAHVVNGRPISPRKQILLYSGDEWEEFIREWAHSQSDTYLSVERFAGAGDMGVDIAAMAESAGLQGAWDAYQCKHYCRALTPADASKEIAKVLWHTFESRLSVPRRYYFVAPHDCGMRLSRLLSDSSALRAHVVDNWDTQCANAITSEKTVPLDGAFRVYVDAFDFGIFGSKTSLQIIDDHSRTPYYAVRFGGGLPDRPDVDPPPIGPKEVESRYLEQLFEAYRERLGLEVEAPEDLADKDDLLGHFNRQRESFYNAEALRNFARDTVPAGTFEDLQEEVHAGVVEVEEARHDDALDRLGAVLQAATALNLTASALISVVKPQDRKGMCHQLANADRLHWRRG